MKVPMEELPRWIETLRASGFSTDEIDGIVSRMPTSKEKDSSSAVKNIRPVKEDMRNWVRTLSDCGFTYEEIDNILARMTMDTDEKAMLRGTLRKVKVAYSDQKAVVPVKLIK